MANFMRAAYSSEMEDEGFPDLLCECDVFDELRTFLQGKVKKDDQATKECPNLHLPWARMTSSKTVKFLLKYGWVGADEERIKPMAGGSPIVSPANSSDSELDGKGLPQPGIVVWVVTKASRGKASGCLHVIGRCFRILGVHYKSWGRWPRGRRKRSSPKRASSVPPSANRS